MERYKRISEKIDLEEETKESIKMGKSLMKDFDKLFSKSMIKIIMLDDNSEVGDEEKEVNKSGLKGILGFRFEFRMDTHKDPFVDNSFYDNGSAYIYPTDKALKMVEKVCNGYGFKNVIFNNTGRVFSVMNFIYDK